MNTTQTLRRTDPRQTGWTLIELIMVIVILGILAAVAVPKFTDLSGEAEIAAANGILGAAESAAAMNFASMRVGKTGVTMIIDGTTLLNAMDKPTNCTATGQKLTFTASSGKKYDITVTAETAAAKASLAKSW